MRLGFHDSFSLVAGAEGAATPQNARAAITGDGPSRERRSRWTDGRSRRGKRLWSASSETAGRQVKAGRQAEVSVPKPCDAEAKPDASCGKPMARQGGHGWKECRGWKSGSSRWMRKRVDPEMSGRAEGLEGPKPCTPPAARRHPRGWLMGPGQVGAGGDTSSHSCLGSAASGMAIQPRFPRRAAGAIVRSVSGRAGHG